MTAPALQVYANGQSNAVSGDQLNTFQQTCNTFADLRAFPGTPGLQIACRGRTNVGDGLGGDFYWNAASTAADNNNTIVAAQGQTVGRWLRLSSYSASEAFLINVQDFGAIGDSTTGLDGADDTVAINAAFNWLRANTQPLNENGPQYFVNFPFGGYRTTAPINATGIRNRVWGIKGPGVLYADFTGGNVLDTTFSRFPHLYDFHVETAAGAIPAIGILAARESNLFVADDYEWDNVHVVGTFSLACVFNYGSEDFAGENCHYLNNSASTSAYCEAQDGTNALGASSTFQTIPTNTPTSFNSVCYSRSDMRRPNGGPCLYMARTDGHSFNDGFLATTSGPAVIFNTTAAIFNRNPQFRNTHIETNGLTTCFRLDGDATQTIAGLEYSDFNPFASDEIFLAGTGVTAATLVYPKVQITGIKNGVNPTNGIFSPASAFRFKKPDIKVYNNGATVFELWDGITLGASGVASAVTGTTNETVLATIPIYPNIMGLNGALIVTSYWSITNSANNKVLSVRVGASGSGLTGSIWGQTTQTTVRSMRWSVEIHNRGLTNSQVLMNGIGTGGWSTTVQAPSTDTRDTTVAMDMVLTGTLANAGETIQLEYYTVELRLP